MRGPEDKLIKTLNAMTEYWGDTFTYSMSST